MSKKLRTIPQQLMSIALFSLFPGTLVWALELMPGRWITCYLTAFCMILLIDAANDLVSLLVRLLKS